MLQALHLRHHACCLVRKDHHHWPSFFWLRPSFWLNILGGLESLLLVHTTAYLKETSIFLAFGLLVTLLVSQTSCCIFIDDLNASSFTSGMLQGSACCSSTSKDSSQACDFFLLGTSMDSWLQNLLSCTNIWLVLALKSSPIPPPFWLAGS